MSFLCFAGIPGAGKTYDTVKKILDNLKLGRKVYTNVDGLDDPICQEHIKLYTGLDDFEIGSLLHFLTRDQVVRFWETDVVNEGTEFESRKLICDKGSLIVIDEVHLFFNAREWNTQKNKGFTDWASTHRHDGYDCLMVTQDLEKVDKHVRSLVEWTYVYRKINFFGSLVKNRFICYSYSGDDTHGKPLGQQTKSYDKRIFPCYRSYNASDIKELGIMKHTNILKHPIFYSIPCVVILFIYLFSRSSLASGDLFGAQAMIANSKKVHDRPVTQGVAMLTSQANTQGTTSPTVVPSVPIQRPMSSTSGGTVYAPLAAVTLPEYVRYKIDSYVDLGNGKVMAYVNGIRTNFPSPDVKTYNLRSLVCMARSEIFGK